jgi:Leucine-rich repeat (LRR) protein
VAAFILPSTAQDLYWVGGTGTNWALTANWSATSGGTGGAGIPSGAGFRAIFDANSGAGTNITMNSPATLGELVVTGGYSLGLSAGATTLSALSGSGLRIDAGATLNINGIGLSLGTAPVNAAIDGTLILSIGILNARSAGNALTVGSMGRLVRRGTTPNFNLAGASLVYQPGSILRYERTANTTIPPNQEWQPTIQNLVINSGGFTITPPPGVFLVQNTVEIISGNCIVPGGTTLSVNGATTVSSANGIELTAPTSRVFLNGLLTVNAVASVFSGGLLRLRAGAFLLFGSSEIQLPPSGGTLELEAPCFGLGTVVYNGAGMNLLRYVNTATINTGVEWVNSPTPTQHRVGVAGTGRVNLTGDKICNEEMRLSSGVLDLSPHFLRLNGDAFFGAGKIAGNGVNTTDFSVTGVGTLTGSMNIDDPPNNRFGDVVMDRTAQTLSISNASPLVINATLSLTNGFINNAAPLILAPGATWMGGGNNSYVIGPFRQTINTSGLYVYPIGNFGDYRPVRVNKMNGTGELEVFFNLGGGGTSTDINLISNNRRTRIEVMSGSLSGGFVELQQVGTVPFQTRIAFAPTQTGNYTNAGIGSFPQITVAETPLPFLQNTLSFSITSQQLPDLSTIGPWWAFGGALSGTPCPSPPLGIAITGANPLNGALVSRSNFSVGLTYSHAVTSATASLNVFKQYGGFTGRKLTGSGGVAGNVATFGPSNTESFFPNEPVFSICTNAQTSVGIGLCRGGAGRYLARSSGTGAGNFVPLIRTNTGITAGSTQTLDVNNDGRLDVAVYNSSVGSYTLFLGNGAGGFTAGPTFSPGRSGLFVDVNNDGDLDFVSTNVATSSVRVFINTGVGFLGLIPVPVDLSWGGTSVSGLAVGDFDQDGDNDMAVGTSDGTNSRLVVLRNTATTPFFTSLEQVTSPSVSGTVIFPTPQVQDFDADGDFDILCRFGDQARILRNDGSSIFTAQPIFTVNNAASGFQTEDLQGTGGAGSVELVSLYNNNLQVFGNTVNTFTLQSNINLPPNTMGDINNSNIPQLVDVDADGDLDIVGTAFAAGIFAVVFNNGLGSYRLQTTTVGGQAFSPSLGDFDNDGDVDFVFLDGATGQLVFMQNNPAAPVLTATNPPRNFNTASPTGTLALTFSQAMAASSAAPSTIKVFGSMTGAANGGFSQPSTTQIAFQPSPQPRPNEHIWVTVTNAQSSIGVSTTRATVLGFRMAAGIGPGTLVLASTASVGSQPQRVVVGDLNGDGLIDAVAMNRMTDNVSILRNIGGGQMNAVATVAVDVSPRAIILADMDGDRDLDIVTANSSGAGNYTISILRNMGGFVFAPAVNVAALSGVAAPDDIWAGDLDGDGDLDVAVCSSASMNITLFTNNGTGTLQATTTLSSGLSAPRVVTGGDMDGDGDLDLVTSNTGGGVVVWINMIANATPAPTWPFVPLAPVAGPMGVHSLECVDFDNDGDLDVMVVSENRFATAPNNGAGILFPFTTTTSTTLLNRFRTADMNGDGSLDFIAVGQTSDACFVIPNGGTAAATALGMGAGPVDIAAADVDNDGDLDAVTANEGNNTVSVLLNQPPPVLALSPAILDFGTASVGAPVQQTFTVSGSNLIGNITLRAATLTPFGAPASVLLSPSLGGTYSTTLTVSAAAVTAGLTIHARFVAPTTATLTGNITATALSTVGQTISWQGIGLAAAPQISLIAPVNPLAGTNFSIQGLNFNSVQSVTLAGMSLNLVSSTPSQIIVTAPTSGSGTITVTTLSGSTTSSQVVSVIPRPTISSFGPASGTTGTMVSISGASLQPTLNVLFNGLSAFSFIAISSTNVIALVPMGASTGPITVVTGLGSTTSTASFIVSQPPRISSVSPLLVGGGSLLTITGSNFAGINAVSIGGMAASGFTVSSPSQMPNSITAIVPMNGKSGKVVISNPSGTDTSEAVVTFVPPPVIGGLSPASGGAITTVTVTGANFSNVSKLSVGGLFVAFTIVNDSTITFVGASTSGVVTASSVGGTVSSQQAFTFIPPPLIASFTPTQGSTGSTIIIAGTNFVNIDSVRFGGVRAMISSSNATQIVAVVGTGASGIVEVFTRQGVASSVGQFAFVQKMGDPPLITSLLPTSAYQGDSVVISGQNFGGATQVRFGDSLAASFRVVSSTRIVAVLAGGSTGTVVVATPAGIGVSFFTFRHLGIAPPPMIVTALQRDMSALERVYRFTQGDDWLNKEFWITTASVSRWRGVTVDSSGGELRVTRLELSNNNLQGEIPTALGELTALQVLDISGNRLTGVIPAFLTNCKNLTHLNLGNNQLSGGIPDTLATLTRLQSLSLDSAGLEGQFPSALCGIASLREVDVAGNALTGTVPECLTRLPALASLNMSNNQLSGVLPPYLGNFPALMALSLARNRFTGGIPAELGATLVAAQKHSARDGQISGLTTLQTLDLSGNALTGGLPASLWNLKTLKELRLSSNALTGVLPVAASSVAGLQVLDVSGNRFSGAIPTEYGSMDSLRTLALDSNQLIGEIPSAFQNLRQIRIVGLAWNRFTRLPSLANLSFLSVLRLEGNALSFESIETQIARGRTVTYSPQDSTGRSFDTVATVATQFRLTATGGGTSGRYQWFRRLHGSMSVDTMTRQTAVTLQIDNITALDAGQYWCRITNTAARDLTLWTRMVTVRSQLPPPPPQAPTLVSPNDGTSGAPLSLALRWLPLGDGSASVNVTGYEVQVSVDNFQTLTTTATVAAMVSANAAQWQVAGLNFITAYQWRVRAVNAGGVGPWSEVRRFTTLTRGAAIGFVTLDFGRVTLQASTQSILTLINQTSQNLTIQSVRLTERGDVNFRLLSSGVGLMLQPAQTLGLQILFAPASIGQKTGTLTIVYQTDAGVRDSSEIAAAVVGSGGALQVDGEIIGTVVVGSPRFGALRVINKSNMPTRILNTRFTVNPDSTFSVDASNNGVGRTMNAGDTITVPISVAARDTGQKKATLRLESTLDVVDIPLSAFAVNRRPQDVDMRIALVAHRTDVTPGDTVSLSLVLDKGIIDTVIRAIPIPTFQAELNFNSDILSVEPAQVAYQRTGTSSTTAQIIVNARWDGMTRILGQPFVCRVLNSLTDATVLRVNRFEWPPNPNAVITVTTTTNTFRAAVCEAGGKRFVRQATSNTLVVKYALPPDNDAVIVFGVRETGLLTLTLYDAVGRFVGYVADGLHEAGHYEQHFDTRKLPSGVYTLVLTTPTAVLAERVRVVR